MYLGAGSGLKSRAAAVLKQSSSMYLSLLLNKTRAVDPYSFYAEPDLDPAVFLIADPDPGPAEPNLKKKNHFLKL